MTSNEENKKQLAKNTLMLYFRMFFTLVVSLYTSRVVLNTLGVEDFGIYNVVGGIVMMFAFLNTTLSAASQRFLSFEIGKGDYKQLRNVFSVSITTHFLLAIIILILAETVGLWFLNAEMNISPERIGAANWVYQCSILAFFITIMSVPYNAIIIAHEKMQAFAYISILEVSLKLIIVFILVYTNSDKLKLYAILVLSVAIIIRIVYGLYAKRNFPESKFHFFWDKKIYKEMISFASWNLMESVSVIAKKQGVNIVLNLFYGATLNAARGIGMQVNAAIGSFVSNFQTAITPQVTKSFASGNYKYMLNLVQQGARFSFFLLMFLSLPVLMETHYVLRLWLKIVPEHAVNFVQLFLILTFIDTLSNTMITAIMSVGKIKLYQIVIGILQLCNLPFAYWALDWGYSPESTVSVAIVISIICLISRMLLLKNVFPEFSIREQLSKVVLNAFVVFIIAIPLPYLITMYMGEGLVRFLIVGTTCVLTSGISIIFVGMKKNERVYVWNHINNFINSKLKKRK